MIPKDIFRKVRQIEISTSRLVTDIFAGQYHSVFKGQGIEFDEVREYQFGDDIRTIDWNVTARTGRPYVKKFVEERELTVMVLVDLSRSMYFSSSTALKSQLAAEISAAVALSAIRNNDKVGLLLFSDKIEKFIPPRKGLQHVLRVIREVLYFKPENSGTNIPQALDYLNKVVSRKSICFIISDFFYHLDPARLDQYGIDLKRRLAVANRRHDVIGITINDPMEAEILPSGVVSFVDAESGGLRFVDTADESFRSTYRDFQRKRRRLREQTFRACGMDFMEMSTNESYIDTLVTFFKKRQMQR